jgi:hypothetical protein
VARVHAWPFNICPEPECTESSRLDGVHGGRRSASSCEPKRQGR